MTRAQYWLINGVSLFVALLIALEIRSVHELDAASARAQKAQAPLQQAQQAEPQIQRLIQRTALGATRDPALKDLLAKVRRDRPPDAGRYGRERTGRSAGFHRDNFLAMNPPPRTYSCFPALLIFFAAVTVMDLDQMMTVHSRKLAAMQDYQHALVLRRQVDAQSKWVTGLRQDLLRLAPGDAEAAAIVGELGIRPKVAGN